VFAVVKYVYLLMMWFWFGVVALRNANQVRVAMACWVASVAISGVYAIGQIFFGFPALNDITAFGRATGLSEHFNELGMVSAMALPPALMLMAQAAHLLYRAFYAILASCILLGLLFSVSLGALAGVALAGLVWLVGFALLSGGSKWRLAILLGVLAGGAVYSTSVQELQNLPNFVDRLEHLNDLRSRNDSMDARMATYRAAWEEVREEPLVGVGLDPASATTQAGNEVHNILLINWYEGGIFALIGIIIVLVSIAWLDWIDAIHAATYQQWWLAIALILAYLAFIVDAMTGPVTHTRDIWTFGALALALYSVIRKTRALAAET
jgi:O-antigen ligase